MTRQRKDTIELDGETWFIEWSQGVLFDPVHEGVMEKDAFVATSAWRGYWCGFRLVDGRLVLDDLTFAGPPKQVLGGQPPQPVFETHTVPDGPFRASSQEVLTGYFRYRALGLPITRSALVRCSKDATFARDLELDFRDGALVDRRAVWPWKPGPPHEQFLRP